MGKGKACKTLEHFRLHRNLKERFLQAGFCRSVKTQDQSGSGKRNFDNPPSKVGIRELGVL